MTEKSDDATVAKANLVEHLKTSPLLAMTHAFLT